MGIEITVTIVTFHMLIRTRPIFDLSGKSLPIVFQILEDLL